MRGGKVGSCHQMPPSFWAFLGSWTFYWFSLGVGWKNLLLCRCLPQRGWLERIYFCLHWDFEEKSVHVQGRVSRGILLMYVVWFWERIHSCSRFWERIQSDPCLKNFITVRSEIQKRIHSCSCKYFKEESVAISDEISRPNLLLFLLGFQVKIQPCSCLGSEGESIMWIMK